MLTVRRYPIAGHGEPALEGLVVAARQRDVAGGWQVNVCLGIGLERPGRVSEPATAGRVGVDRQLAAQHLGGRRGGRAARVGWGRPLPTPTLTLTLTSRPTRTWITWSWPPADRRR